jgi:hypothetical protein
MRYKPLNSCVRRLSSGEHWKVQAEAHRVAKISRITARIMDLELNFVLSIGTQKRGMDDKSFRVSTPIQGKIQPRASKAMNGWFRKQ